MVDKSRNIKFDIADIKRWMKSAKKIKDTWRLDQLQNQLQNLINENWNTEYRWQLVELQTECIEEYIKIVYVDLTKQLI